MAMAKRRWMARVLRGPRRTSAASRSTPGVGRRSTPGRCSASRSPWTTTSSRAMIVDPLRLLDCDYPDQRRGAPPSSPPRSTRATCASSRSLVDCHGVRHRRRGRLARSPTTSSTAARVPAPSGCGRGRRSVRATSTSRRCTTASRRSHCTGSRRSGSAASASSATGSATAARIGPGRRPPDEHRRRSARRRAAARHQLPQRGDAAAPRPVRRTARCPTPRWRVVASGLYPQCGAMVLTTEGVA